MLKLHEIIVKEGRVLIGREIEIEISKIRNINELTIWDFNSFMSAEEKKKVPPDKLSKKAGTLIEVDTESVFVMVAEDFAYITESCQIN